MWSGPHHPHYDVTDESTVVPNFLGTTFYLTTSGTSNPATENCITASSKSGYGGTVTLLAHRRIVDNSYDDTSGTNALALWVQPSDLDLLAGDITINLVVEAFGRWHSMSGI